jgi:hypothetical protein
MNIHGDENEKHIAEERLIEMSKGLHRDFSQEEKNHIAKCDRCNRLLGALFRLQRGDY